MKNKIELNKTGYTVEDLIRAKRKAKHNQKQKIQVILLFYKGKVVNQISSYLDISKPTVYEYIKKFNHGGIKELLNTRYNERGRNPKLNQLQQDELKDIIKLSPQEIGFGESTNWSTLSIAAYIKQTYGITMTRSGVREMLVRNDMSYTRPTYVLAKADPQKQLEFIEKLEGIKKT